MTAAETALSRNLLQVEDCNVGPFQPLSFTPKLEWKITEARDMKKLPKLVKIETKIHRKPLVVTSHPAGYGVFTSNGWEFGFGGKYHWLGTKNPEEAIIKTETRLLEWAKYMENYRHEKYFKDIIKKLYME